MAAHKAATNVPAQRASNRCSHRAIGTFAPVTATNKPAIQPKAKMTATMRIGPNEKKITYGRSDGKSVVCGPVSCCSREANPVRPSLLANAFGLSCMAWLEKKRGNISDVEWSDSHQNIES